MDTYLAYCPECSHSLGHGGRYALAVANGQQHARITGHVVSVVYEPTWQHVETLYGEPGLPLW